VQPAQHRPLLVLMRFHAQEDVVERSDGLDDVRPLVEQSIPAATIALTSA
jgi:hypothetical protein